MPTLYSRSTAIQLSVSHLSEATTAHPIPHQSPEARSNIQNATNSLVKASRNGTLMEDPINSTDGESHLRFLGKKQDMPFFLVQAGKDYFNPNASGRRTKRPIRSPLVETKKKSVTRASPIAQPSEHANLRPPIVLKPHALCLTVFLSTASFFRRCDPETKRTTFSDVKIDVYFNGELCSSAYVPERYRGEAFAMSELIVRFSGRRIGRCIEKPWIIVPPGQNPDGTQKEDKRDNGTLISALERWTALSKALNLEAERSGRDENGELTVGGEYLSSLAELEKPAMVEQMQEEGGPSFGIVDVVVISGRGQKDDAGCPSLLEPTPIRMVRHGMEVDNLLKPRRSVNLTSSFQERQKGQTDPLTVDRTLEDISMSRTRAKPTTSHLITAGSDMTPGSGSDTPCLAHIKPSTVHSQPSSGEYPAGSDIPRESAFQTRRRTSTPNSQSQSSRDRPHDTAVRAISALDQKDTKLNVVVPLRRVRSNLHTELAAPAFNTSGPSFRSGEVSLTNRLRRPTATTQPSTSLLDTNIDRSGSFPVRPPPQPTTPPLLPPGPVRLSQSANARARNLSGSFVRHQRSSSSSAENTAKQVPQKRYEGPNSSPPPKSPKQAQPKRARMPYEMVLTDKRTAAEEIEAIEEEVKKELEMGGYRPKRAIRARVAWTGRSQTAASTAASPGAASTMASPVAPGMAASPGAKSEITESPKVMSPKSSVTGISHGKVQLKLNGPAPSHATRALPSPSSNTLPTHPTPPKRSRTSSTPPSCPKSTKIPTSPQPISRDTTPSPPTPAPNSSKPQFRPLTSNEALTPTTLDSDFVTPPLSRDSVLTYACPGILRQVRGERGGWFMEEAVIMGVRFVVGWSGRGGE